MNEVTLIVVCVGAAVFSGIISGAITAAIISKKKSYKNIDDVIKKAGKIKNYSEIGKIIASQVDENLTQHEKMEKGIDILNYERRKNIKKIGHIRYNSNTDIGGNLSFSLVMLNEENTGAILTNIHMMEGSSLYLREVVNGECEITISEEEKVILRNTINK
ncbi:MAG: DUF4446 family protein [Clostridiales bacterium]|nr:DUF4446 family protein [Clostridiales bacterium]